MDEFMKLQKNEDLIFVKSLSLEALVELCKVAFDFLKCGPNSTRINTFVSKHGGARDETQSSAEFILLLMTTSIKENSFDINLLENYDFQQEQIEVLHQFVLSKKELVSKLFQNPLSNGELRYRGLDWRVEAKIATRAQNSQATPLITMKLHLDSETNGDKKCTLGTTEHQVIIQMDPNSLSQTIRELESALNEAKAHRTKMFVKNIEKE